MPIQTARTGSSCSWVTFADILRLYGGPSYLPAVGDEIVLRANVVEFFSLTELSSRARRPDRTGLDPATETLAIEADPPD